MVNNKEIIYNGFNPGDIINGTISDPKCEKRNPEDSRLTLRVMSVYDQDGQLYLNLVTEPGKKNIDQVPQAEVELGKFGVVIAQSATISGVLIELPLK